MKRILSFLLILLALLSAFAQAAPAAAPVMPDPMEVSDKLVFAKNLDNEFCLNRNYQVADVEDVPGVVLAYLERLMQYDQLVYTQCTTSPSGWVYHVFAAAEDCPYDTFYHYAEDSDWRTQDALAAISYKPTSRNIYFHFSLDLTLWQEEEPTPEPTAAPTAKPTAKPTTAPKRTQCDICEGSGDCPDCGGDMWWEGYKWKYVKGSPESVYVRELCTGRYCYGGSCDRCGGDGWLD